MALERFRLVARRIDGDYGEVAVAFDHPVNVASAGRLARRGGLGLDLTYLSALLVRAGPRHILAGRIGRLAAGGRRRCGVRHLNRLMLVDPVTCGIHHWLSVD